MRFMILVKADEKSEAGVLPGEEVFEAMTDYHEELAKAGVLLDAAGLRPTSDGWRITFSEGEGTITDGPFTEAKELVAGYTLIQVRSPEEAREWVRRFPGTDGEIEVRRLYAPEDFDDMRAMDRFRNLDLPSQREES